MNNQYLERKNIIFYDGICCLCNKSIGLILSRDKTGKLSFLALQSELASEILGVYCVTGEPLDKLSSLVYLRNGQVKMRSTAALDILYDLGGIYRLCGLLYLIPVTIRDFFYDQIAKRRYKWFGKREVCPNFKDYEGNRFL